MNEGEDVQEMIRKFDSVSPPPVTQSVSDQQVIQEIRNDLTQPCHVHVRGAPLFEVFSVIINSSHKSFLNNPGPCEVSGFVQYVNKEGLRIDLFCRMPNAPYRVDLGGTLPLTYADVGPIIPSTGDLVLVYLEDATRKLEIAKGFFGLSYTKSSDCERVQVIKVEGENGDAIFHYTTFLCGVLASVKAVPLSRMGGGSSQPPPDVCISVRARLGTFYGLSATNNLNKDSLTFTLLDNRLEGSSGPLEFDVPVKLSKPMVAVPAYSTLIVEFYVWDRSSKQLLDNGCLEFEPYDCGTDSLRASLHYFDVRVSVSWSHPFEDVVETKKYASKHAVEICSAVGKERKECGSTESDQESMTSQQKIRRFQPEELEPPQLQCQQTINSENGWSTKTWNCYALGGCSSALVEIFSVVVGPKYDNVMQLHGTIKVTGFDYEMYLFNREKNNPDVLPPHSNTLPIVAPYLSICGNSFLMRVNVKDEMDRVIGCGVMEWELRDFFGRVNWYDKPICSVIRGEHGYVAVYYTILSEALQANVNVKFVTADSCKETDLRVYGKITSRYDDFDYPRNFESENYLSVLFAKTIDNCQKLNCGLEGSSLALSKDVVSVRSYSSLIIDFDLKVGFPSLGHGVTDGNSTSEMTSHGCEVHSSSFPTQNFLDNLEFVPCVDSSRQIYGNGFSIIVNIEWRTPHGLEVLEPGFHLPIGSM